MIYFMAVIFTSKHFLTKIICKSSHYLFLCLGEEDGSFSSPATSPASLDASHVSTATVLERAPARLGSPDLPPRDLSPHLQQSTSPDKTSTVSPAKSPTTVRISPSGKSEFVGVHENIEVTDDRHQGDDDDKDSEQISPSDNESDMEVEAPVSQGVLANQSGSSRELIPSDREISGEMEVEEEDIDNLSEDEVESSKMAADSGQKNMDVVVDTVYKLYLHVLI